MGVGTRKLVGLAPLLVVSCKLAPGLKMAHTARMPAIRQTLQTDSSGSANRWLPLAAIFDGTFCHSNSVATPVERVRPCLSKRNKEVAPKMGTGANDLYVALKRCRGWPIAWGGAP